MSDITYIIDQDGRTYDVDALKQAMYDVAVACQPVLEEVSRGIQAFANYVAQVIDDNPVLAAYLQQLQQRPEPRGLVHPASQIGRERRHERRS